MTVIALSGEVGAGKDTCADIIVDRLGARGLRGEIIRFAQPIKNTCYDLGIDPDTREQKELVQAYDIHCSGLIRAVCTQFPYLTGDQQEEVVKDLWIKLINCPRSPIGEKMFSPRQFQQWLGEAVRTVKQDYYVQHLLAECAKRPTTCVIVPDCRYPNEVGTAHTSVYITRPDNPLRISTTDSSEAHQEQLRDMAEFLVTNYEAPCHEDWQDCLEGQIDFLISELIGRGYLDDVQTIDTN